MMREQKYGRNSAGQTIIVEDSKETKQQRLGFYKQYYNELMKKVKEAGGKNGKKKIYHLTEEKIY